MQHQNRQGILHRVALAHNHSKRFLIAPFQHMDGDRYFEAVQRLRGFLVFPSSFEPPFMDARHMLEGILQANILPVPVLFDSEAGKTATETPITLVRNVRFE